jgi:tetratricopeptide (TPR) repeat protein
VESDFRTLLHLAGVHKKLGNAELAEEYLKGARSLVPSDDWYSLAALESLSGNTDAAIQHLKQAVQEDEFDRMWALVDPDFETIRDRPSFREIVDTKSRDRDSISQQNGDRY